MKEQLRSAIEVLQEQLRDQDREVAETKRLINKLCERGGQQAIYPDADVEATSSLAAMQRDQFYGKVLGEAMEAYLHIRRASRLGPATVNEMYEDLMRGGYVFNAKNVANAKRSIYIVLGKKTDVFHKLAGSADEFVFGLLEWYPAARQPSNSSLADDAEDKQEQEAGKGAQKS